MIRTMQYDCAQVMIYDSNTALGAAAADDLASILKRTIATRDEAAIILATGNSQLSFLKALRSRADIDWGRVRVFHMDEYLGMAAQHRASFRRYLRQHLIDAVHPAAFYVIAGDAPMSRRNYGATPNCSIDTSRSRTCLGSARTGISRSTIRRPTSTPTNLSTS